MKKILSFVMILLVVIPLTMLPVFTPISTVPTEAEINQAISLGMQWLAGQQSVDGSWGTVDQVGKTGFAVLKFETHAVSMGEDPLDPTYEYYDQVRNGLDYIFANANITEISMQPAGDPDTDGDGIGVYFGGLPTYETGIAMMAIAASTHPEMVVDVPGSSVDGWTYEDVLQDAVNYLAFGQTDAGTGRGGWMYEEIDNGTSESDNSNTGYAVLGLAYAEAAPPHGFALTIPAFAKSELNVWIDYIQNDPGPLDDGGEDDPDGGSGYEAPDDWVNILKTGNLLFEMAFVGDTVSTPRVVNAIDYIVRHWNDANYSAGWRGPGPGGNLTWPACYQAMYTTMKGLKIFGIDEIDGINWFDEFSDVLVAQQNSSDGSWPNAPMFGNPDGTPAMWDTDQIISTEWALLTLQKEAPPAYRWVIKAPLPDLLEGAAGAVVENKIYVLKGHSEMVGDTGDVRIYDPTTDFWSYGTPSPIVDAEFYQAGVVSGKIYVIGGRNTFTANQEYDPLTDTWNNKTSMPTGRAGHALAVVNDTIYVIGGRNGSEPLEGNVTNVVEAYDPSTDIWTTGLTPMPTARSDTTAAVVNEKIYVVGGWNGTSILSTVEVYDPVNDTWSPRVSMHTQRADLGAVECSGHIHAIGGINATGNGNATQVSTHEIYDPATDIWSFAEPMLTPRAELVVVNVGGTIYAIGGGIYGESVDANEAYMRAARVHDIAVLGAGPARMRVPDPFFGMVIPVAAMVVNNGTETETFNVSIFYDTILIGTSNVTSDAGDADFVSFEWDLETLPKGNYIVSANASIVPGETNTADNYFLGGEVRKTFDGDMTADGIVDASDLFDLNKAYGSTTLSEDINSDGTVNPTDTAVWAHAVFSFEGAPHWNPYADLYVDGFIDLADYYIIRAAFGQTGSPNWNPYADMNADNYIGVLDLFQLSKNYGMMV